MQRFAHFVLLGFFAFSLAVQINSITDIPEGGILTTLQADGLYARLLPNFKLRVDVPVAEKAARAAEFWLTRGTGDNVVHIRSAVDAGLYVSAEWYGKKSLRATRGHTRTWETFYATVKDGGMFLQSAANSKYLAVQEPKTVIASTTNPLEAATFVFELVQDTITAAPEIVYFLFDNNFPIGGLGDTVSLASKGAGTVEIIPVATQSNPLWKSYNLRAIQNNKLLCSEDRTLTASCSDPTAANTHFHFWAPRFPSPTDGMDTSALFVLANFENRLAQISATNPYACTADDAEPCGITFVTSEEKQQKDVEVGPTFQFNFPATSPPPPIFNVKLQVDQGSTWSLESGQVVIGSALPVFELLPDGLIVVADTDSYVGLDADRKLIYGAYPTDTNAQSAYKWWVEPASYDAFAIRSQTDGKYVTVATDGTTLVATGESYEPNTTGFNLSEPEE